MRVNNIDYVEATSVDAAIRHYQDAGCLLEWHRRGGCAKVNCQRNRVFVVCEPRSNLPRSPSVAHGGMNKAYADCWGEVPD